MPSGLIKGIAEPARPYADFRRAQTARCRANFLRTTDDNDARCDRRGALCSSAAAAPQPASAYGTIPSALNDPALAAFPASQLHPYDHHRAALIGLSTALVAAIVIIVVMMANFSGHGGVDPEKEQHYQSADGHVPAEQPGLADTCRAAAATGPASGGTGSTEPAAAQANAQAYQTSQQQLRQHQQTSQQLQQANQQLQQQGQAQLSENEQRTYVTQIRLAKQAWDRGDTNQVLQLLEPYRSDPARQKLRTFRLVLSVAGGAQQRQQHAQRTFATSCGRSVFTPDGSQIVSFADDGQLIVWDAAMGRKLSAVTLERNVPPRSAGLIVEDQLARRASGLVVVRQRRLGRRLWPRPVCRLEHPPARRRAARLRSHLADHLAGHQPQRQAAGERRLFGRDHAPRCRPTAALSAGSTTRGRSRWPSPPTAA